MVRGDHFIATSFGPSPKLLVSPVDCARTASPIIITSPKKATDIWTSLYLPNGGVALGKCGRVSVLTTVLIRVLIFVAVLFGRLWFYLL